MFRLFSLVLRGNPYYSHHLARWGSGWYRSGTRKAALPKSSESKSASQQQQQQQQIEPVTFFSPPSPDQTRSSNAPQPDTANHSPTPPSATSPAGGSRKP